MALSDGPLHPASFVAVTPTLNEADSLPLLVESFFACVPAEAELLVVDDASPDGTANVCRRLMAGQPRLHLLERRGPPGFGRAQTAGLLWALERGYARIGTLDADLSHDPAHLAAMLRLLENHDVVVGSRYVRDGGTVNWSVGRQLLSLTANSFAAALLGMRVHDMTSGYRLYRADALRGLPLDELRSTGYSFLVELLYRLVLAGARVAESPIIFLERRTGRSKLHRSEIWRGGLALLRMRWALRGARRAPAPSA